jgi:hypothetical protein
MRRRNCGMPGVPKAIERKSLKRYKCLAFRLAEFLHELWKKSSSAVGESSQISLQSMITELELKLSFSISLSLWEFKFGIWSISILMLQTTTRTTARKSCHSIFTAAVHCNPWADLDDAGHYVCFLYSSSSSQGNNNKALMLHTCSLPPHDR